MLLRAVGVAGDFGARCLEKRTGNAAKHRSAWLGAAASLSWGLPWHSQCRGCSCCSLPLVGPASEMPAGERDAGAACRQLQCDPVLHSPAQAVSELSFQLARYPRDLPRGKRTCDPVPEVP